MFGTVRFTVRSLVAASAVVALAAPLTPSAAQGSARSLVVLLAHADDETAAAPALARYAREGVTVQMIIVSDGAGGSGRQPGSTRPDSGPVGEALVKARAEEARCAASALGAQAPVLLGFPDGKLGDYLGDRGLLYRVTERIAKELERLHPAVVVTWGPDGGTGHPPRDVPALPRLTVLGHVDPPLVVPVVPAGCAMRRAPHGAHGVEQNAT